MFILQQNGGHNGDAITLAPCHVCDELVKLHGLAFHAVKLLLKKPKHHLGLK